MKEFLKKNYSYIFVLLLALLILIKNALIVGFMHNSNHFGINLFYGIKTIGLNVFIELFIIIFFFSFSLLFKKKGRYNYLLIIYLLISILGIVDTIYCRCFQGAPHIYWLFMNSGGEANSAFFDISIYVTITDIFLILDIPLVIFLFIYGKKKDLFISHNINSLIPLLSSFVLALSLSFINTNKTFKSANTEDEVACYTPLGYHLIDFYDSLTIKKKAKITKKDLEKYDEYQRILEKDENDAIDNTNSSGILKDSNLIVLQLEAYESFLINQKINDKEITPNLNKLLDNAYLFNVCEQVKNGNSSDCDLMFLTGQFPLDKAINFNHFKNSEYHSLPEELKLNGYETLYINGCDASQWGYKSVETTTIGFDREIYQINGDFKLVGYVADEFILDKAIDEIKNFNSKFYTHVVLTSSHFPYPKSDLIDNLDLPKGLGKMGNYINLAHYVDKAIGDFVNELDELNLLDNTTILIMGDHGGIHKYMPHKANKLENKYPFMGNSNNYTVPVIIYNKTLDSYTSDKIGGQIDILPTLSYLYDLKFDYNGRIFMGRNLLKTNLSFAYLANGNLIGNLSNEYSKILKKGYYLSDKLIRGDYYKNN